MKNARKLVALLIGAVIFAVGFMAGFMIQPYLGTHSSTQSPSTNVGNLIVESYTPRLLTQYAVEFTLRNTGTTDIQITDVELNGYSNQTTNGMNQGWNGTTFLQPDQTGILYVYAPSYAYIIDQTMPQITTNPTQTELENLETWMDDYNSTFTFVTNTAIQYNYTIPGLGYGLASAIEASTSSMTITSSNSSSFTSSSSITITNVQFSGSSGDANNRIVLVVKNTGTTQVTIAQVKINNNAATIDSTSTLTYSPSATGTLTLDAVDWVNGNPYQFNLYDSSGNGICSYQVNSPGS